MKAFKTCIIKPLDLQCFAKMFPVEINNGYQSNQKYITYKKKTAGLVKFFYLAHLEEPLIVPCRTFKDPSRTLCKALTIQK